MPLPLTLPIGMVAIYGDGYQGTTPNGMVLEPDFRIGTIYNIWAGGETYIYGNDTIFFKEGEQYCRVVTSDNITYTIIPVTKVVTEDPLGL